MVRRAEVVEHLLSRFVRFYDDVPSRPRLAWPGSLTSSERAFPEVPRHRVVMALTVPGNDGEAIIYNLYGAIEAERQENL